MFKAIKSNLTNAYKVAIRSILGHEFTVWHCDSDGDVKVFHCKTYQEAHAWVSCALNCSVVKIINRQGYLVAMRDSVKVC